jgi:hypothetical protein
MDEEKSNYAGLAEEIGFGLALLQSLQWLVAGHSGLVHLQKRV